MQEVAHQFVDFYLVFLSDLLGILCQREDEYLVDERGDQTGILLHGKGHLLALGKADIEVRVGDDLREAADDVQRCAHLVGDVLDEGCLGLVSLQSTLIGYLQLFEVSAACLYDIDKCTYQQ